VQWAIDRGVDIISFGLTMSQGSDDFQNVMNNAWEKDIVVLCLTDDGGSNRRNAYPANYSNHVRKPEGYRNILTITAYDKNWKISGLTRETECHYCFNVKNSLIEAETFVGHHTSGSSLAMATATGLASLFLSCYHLVENQDVAGTDSRVNRVINQFKKMFTLESSN
jgi:hypothetical protein